MKEIKDEVLKMYLAISPPKLSDSQRNKANVMLKDLQFFLSYKSYLSAYKVLYPKKSGKQKSTEMLCYLWKRIGSADRRKLKEIGVKVRSGEIKLTEKRNGE